MDYFSAEKLAKANKHLVGKIVEGATIDEIIIMPTNEEEHNQFVGLFRRYMDAQRAIMPFLTKDVEVFALFEKKLMRTPGAFMFCSIYKLPKEIGVVTELLA